MMIERMHFEELRRQNEIGELIYPIMISIVSNFHVEDSKDPISNVMTRFAIISRTETLDTPVMETVIFKGRGIK